MALLPVHSHWQVSAVDLIDYANKASEVQGCAVSFEWNHSLKAWRLFVGQLPSQLFTNAYQLFDELKRLAERKVNLPECFVSRIVELCKKASQEQGVPVKAGWNSTSLYIEVGGVDKLYADVKEFCEKLESLTKDRI